jgi:hypothetical protein
VASLAVCQRAATGNLANLRDADLVAVEAEEPNLAHTVVVYKWADPETRLVTSAHTSDRDQASSRGPL